MRNMIYKNIQKYVYATIYARANYPRKKKEMQKKKKVAQNINIDVKNKIIKRKHGGVR